MLFENHFSPCPVAFDVIQKALECKNHSSVKVTIEVIYVKISRDLPCIPGRSSASISLGKRSEFSLENPNCDHK